MKVGRLLRKGRELRSDWDDIKISVMKKGLLAKFSQNLYLRKRLLETGDLNLAENSPSDLFWGVKGENMLGKLLMEVRTILRDRVILTSNTSKI